MMIEVWRESICHRVGYSASIILNLYSTFSLPEADKDHTLICSSTHERSLIVRSDLLENACFEREQMSYGSVNPKVRVISCAPFR